VTRRICGKYIARWLALITARTGDAPPHDGELLKRVRMGLSASDMTLCHISPQGDAAVEGIRQALGELRMEEGFDLLLDWSGVWPHNGIAVVRPQPNAALDRLQQAVVRQLAPWLSGRHDDWAPHITIARKASGATAPTMPPVRWPVREFQFVRSWLKTRPVWHEVLASYPLQSFGRKAGL